MDKNTYLRHAKERLTNEYVRELRLLNECFKSDNVHITVYIEKIVFEYLDFRVSDGHEVELDPYDLKVLLNGKLPFPANSSYANGEKLRYVTQWFVDKCPKCGCYLYYPLLSDAYGYSAVCANCFEERTLERDKAINFPTDSQHRLVNYKFYTVAGNMDREELEQFMKELGVGKYSSNVLRGISKDLKRLELCDKIDEDSKNVNKMGKIGNKFTSLSDEDDLNDYLSEDDRMFVDALLRDIAERKKNKED